MDNESKQTDLTVIPNPYKIWEDMYFAFEKAFGSSMLQMVNSQGFADGLDLILNSYLQYLKFKNDLATKYMKDTPFATRRDMARVAELVVSLESKVDRIEDYLIDEISKNEENELKEEKVFHSEVEADNTVMIDNQTRMEKQLQDVKTQVGGLETDLASIKECLQELKDMLKGS